MISSAVEPIHIFRKIGERKVSEEVKEKSKVTLEEFREFRDALWNINGISDKHSAAFPYELPKRLIKMFSFVGDTILDPFVGGGTTIKAAKDLNRNSVGIDIQPKFLKIMEEKLGFRQSKLHTNSLSQFEVLYLNEKTNVIEKFEKEQLTIK
jgi:DNA modification methylase